METIFTAPFTGVGYFIAASDDFADMNLTQLDVHGDAMMEPERIISSGYTRYDLCLSSPTRRADPC